MPEQLSLFDEAPLPDRTPLPKIKLVRTGKPASHALPTGFPHRLAPQHSDYQTTDGRFVIEANWWLGGHWCVFDTTDPAQMFEANCRLARFYFDAEITSTTEPLTTETGLIVQTLDEARQHIARVQAVTK